MTDDELMRALYAEGLPPYLIAQKFEVSTRHVNKVLGLRGLDPRSIRTYQRFWNALGDEIVTTTKMAERLDMKPHSARVYLLRLEDLGQIRRVGVRARRQVLWQMVRIDELLPAEPVAA